MYNYQPIKDVYIRDFRCLGDIHLSFAECPIITLVGDNESGKTSVEKAFGVAAAHTFARDQKDFIRDNTDAFGVAIELADGTQIIRRKGKDINLYTIKRPDGTSETFPKLAEGLPTEVQKLMGLIEEPETGELLHIRTYEDKLLFVESKSSDNYKVMYNALKVENITKAIKAGSQEVNKLKSDIKVNDVSIETLNGQVQAIKTYDIDNLVLIKNSIKQELENLRKIEKCREQLSRIKELDRLKGALKLIEEFNLSTIDELQASRLVNAYRIYKKYCEVINYKPIIEAVSVLDNIDTSVLNSITSIINKRDRLEEVKRNNSALSEASTLTEINTASVSLMEKIIGSIKRLEEIKSQTNVVELQGLSEINTHNAEVASRAISLINIIQNDNQAIIPLKQQCLEIEQYLKNSGVAVETCSKCGNTIIFDIDKLGL